VESFFTGIWYNVVFVKAIGAWAMAQGIKELVGHTPVEVIAGAILGIILAFVS